jgi:hypothetical protein
VLKYLRDSSAHRSARGVTSNQGNARGAAYSCPTKKILLNNIPVNFKKRMSDLYTKCIEYTEMVKKNQLSNKPTLLQLYL